MYFVIVFLFVVLLAHLQLLNSFFLSSCVRCSICMAMNLDEVHIFPRLIPVCFLLNIEHRFYGILSYLTSPFWRFFAFSSTFLSLWVPWQSQTCISSCVHRVWHLRYGERMHNQRTWFFFLLFLCSEELRRWFLQQEMDLFRYRFHELTDSLRQKFLDHVNLSFEAVSMLLSGSVLCRVCLMLF